MLDIRTINNKVGYCVERFDISKHPTDVEDSFRELWTNMDPHNARFRTINSLEYSPIRRINGIGYRVDIAISCRHSDIVSI